MLSGPRPAARERRWPGGRPVVVLAPGARHVSVDDRRWSQGCSSAIASQTVAKCISMGGHDRAVDDRWTSRRLAGPPHWLAWAIPDGDPCAHGPSRRGRCRSGRLRVAAVGGLETPSSTVERELPSGSGGRCSTWAAAVVGRRSRWSHRPPTSSAVDEQPGDAGPARRAPPEPRGVACIDPAGSVAGHRRNGARPPTSSSATTSSTTWPTSCPFLRGPHRARPAGGGARADRATTRRPTWNAAWRHFWEMERPTARARTTWSRSVEAWVGRRRSGSQPRPAEDDPFQDRSRAVRAVLRRLCLGPERAPEVAAFLDRTHWSAARRSSRFDGAGQATARPRSEVRGPPNVRRAGRRAPAVSGRAVLDGQLRPARCGCYVPDAPGVRHAS